MKLYEYEGKQILKEAGFNIPEGYVVEKEKDIQNPQKNMIIKAQTLEGKRGKAGLIKSAKIKEEMKIIIKELQNKKYAHEKIEKILIEEKCTIKNEFYIAVTYDTKTRNPVIIASSAGGMDIEETRNIHPSKVIVEQINILHGITEHQAKEIIHKAEIPNLKMIAFIQKLYTLFMEKDMKLLEINPVAEVVHQNDHQKSSHERSEYELFCLDAKIILDDDAFFRQNWQFPPRIGIGRQKTQREMKANEISAMDHRGIAGKTFIEMDGDVGILASGGGASITAVDALLSYGEKPANYTEYSGNPGPEKVEALTRLVLEIANMNGLFVVGAKANFTRIDETIAAIIKVIKEKKPMYPIVFRRAGPGDTEAKELVEKTAKELSLDMEWYGAKTPVTVAAKRMADKVKKYKKGK